MWRESLLDKTESQNETNVPWDMTDPFQGQVPNNLAISHSTPPADKRWHTEYSWGMWTQRINHSEQQQSTFAAVREDSLGNNAEATLLWNLGLATQKLTWQISSYKP